MRTADILAAYVAHSNIPVAELSTLIAATHAAIARLGRAAAPAGTAVERPAPAEVRRSITHEALISFEDGKPYKTHKQTLPGSASRGRIPGEVGHSCRLLDGGARLLLTGPQRPAGC